MPSSTIHSTSDSSHACHTYTQIKCTRYILNLSTCPHVDPQHPRSYKTLTSLGGLAAPPGRKSKLRCPAYWGTRPTLQQNPGVDQTRR